MSAALGAIGFSAATRAAAASIAIDGSTEISQDTRGSALISNSGAGDLFTIVISGPTGVSPVEVCTPSHPCSVDQRITADGSNASGTFGSLKAATVYGSINLTGPTFLVNDLTAGAPYEHNETVTISGLLAGFDQSNHELFEFALAGTGTVTLDGSAAANGSQVSFSSAISNFSGTATATPEPATFFLGGASLAVISFSAFLKRRKAAQSGRKA